MRIGLRGALTCATVSALVLTTYGAWAAPGEAAARHRVTPAWTGFANDAQHTGNARYTPQPLDRVHWHATVDLKPPKLGDSGSIAHYATPMITRRNTVVVPTRLGPHRGFDLVARRGSDGSVVWRTHTDYQVPVSAEDQWPPPLPATLVDDSHVAVAASGGTVLVRTRINGTAGHVRRIAFYGLDRWRAHRAAYARTVQITTPLTVGPDGSLYFGFSAARGAPGHLRNGLAKIDMSGHARWVSASRLAGTTRRAAVALNAAPALSNDGGTGYTAVVVGNARPYLVSFRTPRLAPARHALLHDPQTGHLALVFGSSSATPTVGPDGDVYFGVLGNPIATHDNRGWLLHYNARLSRLRTPGSFGWDQTVSVVPATSVPSYTGGSSYLLVSKYNNYLGAGPSGDGENEIALLDPHAAQLDEYSSVGVMAEVSAVQSPTHQPGAPPDATYEWCINSVAVDPATGVALANNEDGHLYLWDLDTGQLTQDIRLTDPRGQAYTMTVVGPDGTAYAIADATLYAVGS
jgi:hypothetical protein